MAASNVSAVQTRDAVCTSADAHRGFRPWFCRRVIWPSPRSASARAAARAAASRCVRSLTASPMGRTLLPWYAGSARSSRETPAAAAGLRRSAASAASAAPPPMVNTKSGSRRASASEPRVFRAARPCGERSERTRVCRRPSSAESPAVFSSRSLRVAGSGSAAAAPGLRTPPATGDGLRRRRRRRPRRNRRHGLFPRRGLFPRGGPRLLRRERIARTRPSAKALFVVEGAVASAIQSTVRWNQVAGGSPEAAATRRSRHADLMLRLKVFVTIWPAWPGRGDVGSGASVVVRAGRGGVPTGGSDRRFGLGSAHAPPAGAGHSRSSAHTRGDQRRSSRERAHAVAVGRRTPDADDREPAREKMKKPWRYLRMARRNETTSSPDRTARPRVEEREPAIASGDRCARRRVARALWVGFRRPPCARPWGEQPRRQGPPRTPPLRHRATRGEGKKRKREKEKKRKRERKSESKKRRKREDDPEGERLKRGDVC